MYVFVDLVAALVIVLCLAYTLPRSAYYLSNLLSSEAALSIVEINDYLCEAARDPWGFGSWAMLMLATTLFPTAWHAVASVAAPAALMAMRVGVSRDVVLSLESERPTSDAIGIAATYVALWRPLIWLLAGCLVLGALLALAQLLRWAGEPLPKLLLLAASGFDVGRVDVCLGTAGAF